MLAREFPPLRACLLASLLVTGTACSEPIPAARVPTTPAKPRISVAPSPTALTPEQEVEAAVRTYYAELTRAVQTNDTTKVKKLVHKRCPCYGTVQALDEARTAGERTPDAQLTLLDVKVHDVLDDTAAAEVKYTVNAYDVIDKTGVVLERVPSRSDHLDLSLAKSKGVWVVINVFNLEGE